MERMEIIEARNLIYVLCTLRQSIVMCMYKYLDYCMCHHLNMQASTKLMKKNRNNKIMQTQNSLYLLRMWYQSIVMCMYKYLEQHRCHHLDMYSNI